MIDEKYIDENGIAAKQDSVLHRMPNGDILCSYFCYSFHPVCEKALFEKMGRTFILSEKKNTLAFLEGVGVCISKDDGQTFSEASYINIDSFSHFAVRGSMCSVGKSVYSATYAYKKNKDTYQCHLIKTQDGIKWSKLSLLCETKKTNTKKIQYFEPSLLYIKKTKTIAAFIRTHEITKDKVPGYTSLSYSSDSGKTFSSPVKTPIEGYPLHPLSLSDGRFLLVYGYRKKMFGVRMRFMDEHFNFSDEIILEDEMYSSDCGYPWAIETKNKTALIVYYGHYKNGVRFIKLKESALS